MTNQEKETSGNVSRLDTLIPGASPAAMAAWSYPLPDSRYATATRFDQ